MEIELTKENYDGEVIKSNMPVLVDFWASCVIIELSYKIVRQHNLDFIVKGRFSWIFYRQKKKLSQPVCALSKRASSREHGAMSAAALTRTALS